jgi:glycosyltransferase involved in cell wall biosynthesis
LKLNINIKYLLCGKADFNEENRIRKLTKELDIESNVILTGYIKEEELKDHYLVSDAFVMPSKGEGFGIVFLEAMACGREVLAGNKDGSTEALQFGKLGTLVDPDDQQDLSKAILNTLSQPRDSSLIQQNMLEHFSFEKFKKRTASVFLSTN